MRLLFTLSHFTDEEAETCGGEVIPLTHHTAGEGPGEDVRRDDLTWGSKRGFTTKPLGLDGGEASSRLFAMMLSE